VNTVFLLKELFFNYDNKFFMTECKRVVTVGLNNKWGWDKNYFSDISLNISREF